MEEEHELSSISTAVYPAASAPSTDVDARANNTSEDQLFTRLNRHEALLDRQTVRKLDLILLPFLALLFLFNSLDRANVSSPSHKTHRHRFLSIPNVFFYGVLCRR